jgi:hypothetical protein
MLFLLELMIILAQKPPPAAQAPPMLNPGQPCPPQLADAPSMLNPGHPCPSPQRVPVTGSLFFAYAAMRGNIDKDSLESDPLHSSLYINPIKFEKPQFEQRIEIPRWQCENDIRMVQE